MTVSDNNRIDRAERSGSSDARLRSAVIAPPARSLVRSARALAAAALLALSGALAPPAAAQTAPAAPTNFTAAPGNARVGLSWDAPATGSGVTRHEYHYQTGGGSYPATWTQIEDSGVGGANEDGYPVTGLTNETAHTFELRAVSAGGASAAAEAGPVTPTPGICERTQQVRDEILDELAGVSDCAAVTVADLATITQLSLYTPSLTSLQAGDFAGLTEMTGLDLSGNSLSSLPENVFSGLAKLQHLLLTDNSLGSASGRGVLRAVGADGNRPEPQRVVGSASRGRVLGAYEAGRSQAELHRPRDASRGAVLRAAGAVEPESERQPDHGASRGGVFPACRNCWNWICPTTPPIRWSSP